MNTVFVSNPKYAGFYMIGGRDGLRVWLTRRPNWLHRNACRLVLGFVWVDAEPV